MNDPSGWTPLGQVSNKWHLAIHQASMLNRSTSFMGNQWIPVYLRTEDDRTFVAVLNHAQSTDVSFTDTDNLMTWLKPY